ncbi:unnamed protein product [Linum trigynum]|uniref:GRF-type domain-containing protein n=1 Tax=Linum trigynum TaxID=586398 RepID=A0AAV2EA98_9ROSI
MAAPFCHCGEPTDLKTSWTEANPGRRFYGCSRYGVRFIHHCFLFSVTIRLLCRLFHPSIFSVDGVSTNGACNYFRWLDPALDEHMRNVLLNFHRRIRELEKRQNKEVSKFDRKMVSFIILGAIVFFLFWIGK